MQTVLKWHGGKSYLAKWIISLMPAHLHYVEPYFGGGAVLLARDPKRNWIASNGEKLPAHLQGCSEVVNDINERLTVFWQVLKDPTDFAEFQRIVEATPFSESEWEAADMACGEFESRAQAAARFFIRCRQSRQGLSRDFATLSRNRTRGGRNEQANAWLSVVDGLPEIHERLRGVVILNRDALKVIEQQDDQHTLFYCDPPYLHETRSSIGEYGDNEMSEAQHLDLLNTLANIKGKFMLSGYHSRLYDAAAQQLDWKCFEREIDNKASGSKQKEKRLECVWTNY
jgi:DNA adenine methylase